MTISPTHDQVLQLVKSGSLFFFLHDNGRIWFHLSDEGLEMIGPLIFRWDWNEGPDDRPGLMPIIQIVEDAQTGFISKVRSQRSNAFLPSTRHCVSAYPLHEFSVAMKILGHSHHPTRLPSPASISSIWKRAERRQSYVVVGTAPLQSAIGPTSGIPHESPRPAQFPRGQDQPDHLVCAMPAGDIHENALGVFEEEIGARNSRLEWMRKAKVAEKNRRSATRTAGH